MSGIAKTIQHHREKSQGIGCNSHAVKYLNQDYESLRASCLESGRLFEDDCFEPLPVSLGYDELGPNSYKVRGIEWKRPMVCIFLITYIYFTLLTLFYMLKEHNPWDMLAQKISKPPLKNWSSPISAWDNAQQASHFMRNIYLLLFDDGGLHLHINISNHRCLVLSLSTFMLFLIAKKERNSQYLALKDIKLQSTAVFVMFTAWQRKKRCNSLSLHSICM